MKFYHRSSINEEDKFTIWQNGLKERLHLRFSFKIKIFLSFFLDDKTSVPDVFSGCSHFETSSVMVSYEI